MTRSPLTQLAPELVRVFQDVGFTADGIAAYLGPDVHAALYRREPAVVRRATADGSRFAGLIRAFILRDPLPATAFADLVGASLAASLIDARLADVDPHGTVRVILDVQPHTIVGINRWVFSDGDASFTGIVPGPDHVVGVGGASLSLLQATPATLTGSVLDLGTGSGVQALGQIGYAEAITATDIHPRALDLAEATFAAAGASDIELLEGPWFEPVAGRRFDRIVANPPFVVGLPNVGHVYRDSGLNLDSASELVVSQAAEYLAEGGTAHLLAAWVHTPESTWEERVASWIPDVGVSAWFLQRDVADPALHVGTWLRDETVDPLSPEGEARTNAWLDHFESHNVTGIGFGFVALRNIGDAPSEVVAESMTQAFSDPLGPEVEEYFLRAQWLRNRGVEDIMSARFFARPGLVKESISRADTEAEVGFVEAALRLTRTDGPRWSHDVDKHVAALVAGLHPQGLSLGETIGLYAMAQGYEEEELMQLALPAFVDLIRRGMIVPVDLAGDEE
ncbi:Release factor glutamine methyltransferase [Corynebacterium atrinae]|uniref:DUF7782 domain-containing protein n=1 Tax=Corynebacterium atrinae TaxID=1336740 RepID=UPI0025B49E66|nr:methyltransferase [Corynebacterium atrinae]WJY63586.1 Release factor glutamine methyltransferase [Corynebacterium atrinae]